MRLVLNSDDAPKAENHSAAPPRWAMTTFVALFAMNMLDYLDRNLLMSMQPQIKGELRISNFQWGLLTSIFLVSYSLFGPVMGWLGDRYRRTWLLGLGVGVWSLATIGSGLAQELRPTGPGAERAGDRRGDLRRHRSDDPARPVRPRPAGPADVGLLPGDADRQRLGDQPGLDHRIEAEAGTWRSSSSACQGWPRRSWPSPFPSRSAVRARESIPSGSRRSSAQGAVARTISA